MFLLYFVQTDKIIHVDIYITLTEPSKAIKVYIQVGRIVHINIFLCTEYSHRENI